MLPHDPQLLSVFESTQAPPHSSWPLVHVIGWLCGVTDGVAHAPATHATPAAQETPHAPQFFGSSKMLWQLEPQRRCPAGHAHEPAEQTSPGLQAFSQRPQLPVSLARLTQSAPHLISGETQTSLLFESVQPARVASEAARTKRTSI